MQGGKAVCSKLFNNSKPLRKNQRGLPEKYAEIKNQLFSSRMEVQCGQRVASMAISDRQYGHFLVVFAMRPISGKIMSSVRDKTYDINIVQYLANIVNYMCICVQKAKKRMPASGIR